jgi:CheY-like chemotaxis protein
MTRVLIIEDNLEILENTVEILELEGYATITASNGLEGIQQAQQHLPDIILCDIMMPEADGYEVLRTLKSSPETADIPFIYLTASVERKEVQAGFDMGAKGYIRKPFDSDELFKTIEDCVKH